MTDTSRVTELEKEVLLLKVAVHRLIKYIYELEVKLSESKSESYYDNYHAQEYFRSSLRRVKSDLRLDEDSLKAYQEKTGIELPTDALEHIHGIL